MSVIPRYFHWEDVGKEKAGRLMVPLILIKVRIVGQLVCKQQGMGWVGLPVPPQCLKECLYATIYLMTDNRTAGVDHCLLRGSFSTSLWNKLASYFRGNCKHLHFLSYHNFPYLGDPMDSWSQDGFCGFFQLLGEIIVSVSCSSSSIPHQAHSAMLIT